MKKYLIILAATVLTFSIQAQSFVSNNFEDLMEADHTTVVKVSESMFKYASILVEDVEDIDDIEGVDVKEVLGSVKSLEVIVADEIDNAQSEYKKGLAKIDGHYEELVKVKSKDGNFGLYIDEKDGVVYEIIGIGAEEDNFFVGSLLLEIKLEDLSGLIAQIQKKDWKPFKKLGDFNFDKLKVYPNPVSTTSGISLEVPDAMIGGQAQLISASGAVFKTFSVENGSQQLEVDGITPGYYILSVNNAGVTLKQKVLVVD